MISHCLPVFILITSFTHLTAIINHIVAAMSSSSSPCAACKFLRRKCTQGCVFSPYFPPDQPTKFANVHHVFGASNVAKLLNELPQSQREDAVNSLAYEAEARLRDPVYGCVGFISALQTRIKQVQAEIYNAKKELATYIGAAAFSPFLPPFVSQSNYVGYHHGTAAGGYALGGISVNPQHQQAMIREQQQQQQQQYDAQQLAAMAAVAAREQELMMASSNSSNNVLMAGPTVGTGQVHAGLGLGPLQFEDGFNVHGQNELQLQQHNVQMQHQYVDVAGNLGIHTPNPHQQQNHFGQHQRARSDDGRSG